MSTTTPPPVPPPAPTAPPPPESPSAPQRRRRWPWVLGGVLALVVILVAVAITLFTVKIKPPIDAANDFLEDIEDRDFDGAFDELCSADQDQVRSGDLQAIAPLVDDYSVNPFGVDVDGSRATVEFDSDFTDDDNVFELHLRKEDGDWRVCLSDEPGFDSGGLQ